MKKITYFLVAFTILLTACEGPQGPPGFDGFDGQNGLDGEVAPAFEFTRDFIADDDYRVFVDYPFEVFESEVTLVYRLWEIDDETQLEVWRLLPQTVNFEDGSNLVYNFDFTQFDVSVFLESSSDLNTVGNEWTQDQKFRVIVVPTSNFGRVDYSNLNEVMKVYSITDFTEL